MARIGPMLKESMAKNLANRLTEHPNVFVTRVNRLTATDADVLRHKLHAARGTFLMVKRRIGLRTLAQLKLTGIAELFEGSIGLVTTADDALPIAKELVEFVKTHEGQLTVRGAWIDGQLLDQDRVEALAKLPERPQLLALLIGTVELPLADLIMTVERLIGDLAWIVEQAASSRSAATVAPAARSDEPPADALKAPEGQADTAGQSGQGTTTTPEEGKPS